MSIFSGDVNPLPWLQEKTLCALQAAASLVDLANEPDTTAWYKRNLLRIAEMLIDRLAPVVAFLNKADSEAALRDEWGAVMEGGSFALAAWCRKWKIGDPTQIGKGSLLHLRTVEEQDEKNEEHIPDSFDGDVAKALDLKLQIYSFMSRRLVHEQISQEGQKFLLWMLSNLWLSDPPDVVHVSRRFLPTDIGIGREQAGSAYKELYDKGLIERVERADSGSGADRLSLRLVVQGVNDSRHDVQYREEEFGYAGARIAGKVTAGHEVLIGLPETLANTLGRWFNEPQALTELRDAVQAQIGEDRVYIEGAEVKYRDELPVLSFKFRYPFEADPKPLEDELAQMAQSWLTERLFRLS